MIKGAMMFRKLILQFGRKSRRSSFVALMMAAIYVLYLSPLVAYAGNDFVFVNLRSDFQSSWGWKDYQHLIYPTGKPAAGTNGYSTGWFSVDLGQFVNGVPDSAKFTQVGMLATPTAVSWFVYSEATVTCLMGTAIFGNRGCIGDPNQFGGVGAWTKVELVTYGQGFWIARVWNGATNQHADVAKIWSSVQRIYNASAESEAVYNTPTDPHLYVGYWHWHPVYMDWGVGFKDWPSSSGSNINVAGVYPTNLCSQYYGITRSASDLRYWYAGSYGPICSVINFF